VDRLQENFGHDRRAVQVLHLGLEVSFFLDGGDLYGLVELTRYRARKDRAKLYRDRVEIVTEHDNRTFIPARDVEVRVERDERIIADVFQHEVQCVRTSALDEYNEAHDHFSELFIVEINHAPAVNQPALGIVNENEQRFENVVLE
jgi:hypothetical protein